MRMLGRHAMSESFSADCVSDGKNAKAIVCRTCGSKVLRPRLATLVDKEVSPLRLPLRDEISPGGRAR